VAVYEHVADRVFTSPDPVTPDMVLERTDPGDPGDPGDMGASEASGASGDTADTRPAGRSE